LGAHFTGAAVARPSARSPCGADVSIDLHPEDVAADGCAAVVGYSLAVMRDSFINH
jgi:hypothetical protein